MTRDNVKTDIPLNIITTVLLIIFGMHFTLFGIGNDNTLSRLDGVIFLILFSAYMYWSFKSGKAEETKDSAEPESGKICVAILMVL